MTIESAGVGLVKGDRKNFECDFTVSTNLIVKPSSGRKLRLIELRYAFKPGTTDDKKWVFEIAVNSSTNRTIVNQKYYNGYRQLIAQSNEPPMQIDGVLYMKFKFPRLDDPDYNVMELLSSLDMELKIYKTTEAQHPSGPFTPYIEDTSLVGGSDPVAYCVLETVSIIE